jgi:uncharacterized protein (TIGR01244 family)
MNSSCMPLNRRGIPLYLGLVVAMAVAAVLLAGSEVIDKFYRVNERVATGAQPTVGQIGDLAGEGFRTILNLREPSEYDWAAEESVAKELGLRYISIPVKTADPKTEQLEAFLHVTADPTIYPAFFHCGSGNRVGAFWMVRRVLTDHWTIEDAEKEARQIGMKSPNLREFALEYIRSHSEAASR